MNSYGIFARLYDELTENVEYKKRAEYIAAFFNEQGIASGTIVDLACGTGSISKELIDLGYEIIGVDLSADMLSVAQNKLFEYGDEYSLINADISLFQPTQDVDGVVCCLDSVNHIQSKSNVQSTFNRVYNYLKNDGLFIFDVNTVYKHNSVLADNTFVFDNDDYYLVWDNELIDDRTVRIILDIFLFNGEAYDRYCEEFEEIAYTIDEIKDMLKNAGFNDIAAYDELTKKPACENNERIYFVCKK